MDLGNLMGNPVFLWIDELKRFLFKINVVRPTAGTSSRSRCGAGAYFNRDRVQFWWCEPVIEKTETEIRNSKQIQMIKKDKIPNQPFSDFDSALAQEEQSVVKFEEALRD